MNNFEKNMEIISSLFPEVYSELFDIPKEEINVYSAKGWLFF